MSKLENNPHYQNGKFWARNMVKHIENTVYVTVENALEKKKELVEDLKKEFGWDETHKDVAENLGMIAALEEEVEKQPKKSHNLTIEDVDNVAKEIGKKISVERAQDILDRYTSAQEKDPGATWNLVIENLIYEA